MVCGELWGLRKVAIDACDADLGQLPLTMSPERCRFVHAILCWVIVVLFSVLAVGCRKVQTPADLPELHPVTITVRQDGQPLAAASVALYAEGSKWTVGGSTDADGVARIRTLAKYTGAPAGTYKVCVVKELVEDPPSPSGLSTFYDLVDQKFKSPKTTPLEITVSKGEGKPHAFDVGGAIKKKLPASQ